MAKELLYLVALFIGGFALYSYIKSQEQAPVPTAAPPSMQVQEAIWQQISAPVQPQTDYPYTQGGVVPTNACGQTDFGMPNFAGTPREGHGCIDSLDCTNHPPLGHPDYMNCCPDDGTCYK
jgi:hypothetical protein